jgi:Zn finger protein HypA/HybF involved in hydrogenase expression
MTRSWYILWCLHCDHETSDPFAIDAQSCPKCGRNYSGVL